LQSKYNDIKPIIDHLDSDNLSDICAGFDVVIHSANADHVPGINAISAGLEKRAAANPQGRKPLLIHTSGSGVLADRADGKFASTTIYSDDDMSFHSQLAATAWHKASDDVVLAIGDRGIIDVIIVCPSTIFGVSDGLFNTHSIQIPKVTGAFIKAGKGYIIEEGVNTWCLVHVKDVGRVFKYVLAAALEGNIPRNPRDRYYFAESAEFTQKQMAQAVTDALYARGKIASNKLEIVKADVQTPEWENLAKTGLAYNSRCRAAKVKKLGWEPIHGGLKEFLEDAKESVDYVLGSSRG
jgi:nucleoside-diphosphate-sugar epimerase